MNIGMEKAKIGLIGILGKEMKEDFWGTCKRLVEIGYRGIESTSYLLEGNVEDNIKRLKDMGLEPITYAAKKPAIADDIDKVIENAKKLQVRNVSIWFGPTTSKEQLLEDARFYNEAGAVFSSAGLRLCYHNHDHEFKTFFDGVSAIDILAANTDPENFYFELDCGWIAFGGADPVYVLKKMAGRVVSIHIKDLEGVNYPDRKTVVFSAVGTGVVNTAETAKAAIETGVEWVVVEQDRLRNLSPMETVIASYLNLKEAGIAL